MAQKEATVCRCCRPGNPSNPQRSVKPPTVENTRRQPSLTAGWHMITYSNSPSDVARILMTWLLQACRDTMRRAPSRSAKALELAMEHSQGVMRLCCGTGQLRNRLATWDHAAPRPVWQTPANAVVDFFTALANVACARWLASQPAGGALAQCERAAEGKFRATDQGEGDHAEWLYGVGMWLQASSEKPQRARLSRKYLPSDALPA
jgi:hypothetical protein